MRDTSARLLSLLGLLQARPDWPGPELARRLGVTTRTVRHDVQRLRDLGYPVDAVQGPAGHYRLGSGGKLPPLLLDDEEAVAVVVGLRTGTGLGGLQESSARVLAKLDQVLPHRLRRTVAAVHAATTEVTENTGGNVPFPEVAPDLLGRVAGAIRDRVSLRVRHAPGPERALDQEPPRTVEPYRLVSWERHWYLVGRDVGTGTWHPYRVDWLTLRTPDGPRFTPVPLPGGDWTRFVLREVAFAGWKVHVRVTVHAPATEVVGRINAAVGVVEAVDDRTSVLVTGADSYEIVAVYLGMLGLDFTVTEPPELVERLRTLGHRYLRAVSPGAAPASARRSRRS